VNAFSAVIFSFVGLPFTILRTIPVTFLTLGSFFGWRTAGFFIGFDAFFAGLFLVFAMASIIAAVRSFRQSMPVNHLSGSLPAHPPYREWTFSMGQIIAKFSVSDDNISSEGSYQFEGLEPGRVRLFKFNSQKSKSLFRKDLP
jgi:hypothetical protein